jgi:hypothetical protein
MDRFSPLPTTDPARSPVPRHARKPLTLRLNAINLLDRNHALREASGIREFAPQHGPRRGLFGELTRQL